MSGMAPDVAVRVMAGRDRILAAVSEMPEPEAMQALIIASASYCAHFATMSGQTETRCLDIFKEVAGETLQFGREMLAPVRAA